MRTSDLAKESYLEKLSYTYNCDENKLVYERHSRELLNLIACILPPYFLIHKAYYFWKTTAFSRAVVYPVESGLFWHACYPQLLYA